MLCPRGKKRSVNVYTNRAYMRNRKGDLGCNIPEIDRTDKADSMMEREIGNSTAAQLSALYILGWAWDSDSCVRAPVK